MGLCVKDIEYMLHLTRVLTLPSIMGEKGEPARHSSTVLSLDTATKGSYEMDRYLVTNSKIVKQYSIIGSLYVQLYVHSTMVLEYFFRFALNRRWRLIKNNSRQPSSAALYFGLTIFFKPPFFLITQRL